MHSLRNLFYLTICFVFLSCGASEQKNDEPVTPAVESGVKYDEASSRNIQLVMDTYYAVKDALVASDSLKVKEAAVRLANAIDTLQAAADTSLRLSALTSPGIIKEASLNLRKASLLEEQRAIFETISDNLYEVIHTLRPAGVETYKQYCPMAFNDKGAYWLSNTDKIQNPYFGKKMLICGEVQEVLHYK